MTRRSEGFARLDAQIAEYGEEWVLDSFVARISDGEAPHKIAVDMGYPWFVLRSWLEDKPDRIRAWELGKRCFADGLSYESLRAAIDATPEDVSVARLQVDTYNRTAGRLNRDEWGDKQHVEVKNVHSVDIKSLLEARELRLMGITDRIVIEQSDYVDNVI